MIRAVLLDCGDTLVDEATEVKNTLGEALRADLFPGAAEMVRTLRAMGYPLALVADGPVATFRNVLTQHGLLGYFDALAISGLVGVDKPHPLMFETALRSLGVRLADYGRVVMVGNNLERDIRGANALGLTSVFIDASPRRRKVPADLLETPDHVIHAPLDLLPLLARLG